MKRKIVLTLIIVLIGLISLILLAKDKKIIKETKEEIGTSFISMMVEEEVGSNKYVEKTDIKFPLEGYHFNSEESGCENGGILSWNSEKQKVEASLLTSDKCYAYFDKNPFNIDYNFTGNYETFIVPVDGEYQFELWGAQGSNYDDSHQGGKGAYVSGIINLKKNDELYVYVGGHPTDKSEEAGYNGGGAGYHVDQFGYAGGGATDVRLVNGKWDSESGLNSRIMVAAGGGGTGTTQKFVGVAGASGGLIGYDGSDESEFLVNTHYGTGATQVEGGFNCDHWNNCNSPDLRKNIGGFGYGGYDDYGIFGGGGGGGGYYGGGASNRGHAGGGGGSSFISGHTGCVAISSFTDRTPKSGCDTSTINNDCSIHYSNYKFSNTVMIDGLGFTWTNMVDSEQVGMPSPDGGTEEGNTGNGYARITLVK